MKHQMQADNGKEVLNMFLRYVFLLAVALVISFSGIFYLFLLKLAVYPVSFLLNILAGIDSFVVNDLIIADSATIIQLIPACVAVSAYFLLLILNLTTQMSAKKRIYSILFSFALFSALNIIRITVLSLLLINDFAYFDIVHKITWYSLSIILVAGVWFMSVYLFGIKNIPVYSDFKYIINLMRKK